MTSRTRTAKATATTPAKKTATKPATDRTTRKRTTTRKTTAGAPKLSLVKTGQPLPTRTRDFMTDTQGYATLAALIVGIRTPHINDWRDHRDGTATRPLADGSTLHYTLATRTLTWQAICPMGAIHEYRLTSYSTACAARVHADRCQQPHTDLSNVKPLTADELEALGILHTPGWARPALPGEPATESIPVPLPDREPRALADHLTRSDTSTDETQPLSQAEIAAGIAARAAQAADSEKAKEHPEP